MKNEIISKCSQFCSKSYATYLVLFGRLKQSRKKFLFGIDPNTVELYCWNEVRVHTRVPHKKNLRLRSSATSPLDLNLRPCSAETCPLFWNVGTGTNFWVSYLPLFFERNLLCFYSFVSFADSQMFFSFCDRELSQLRPPLPKQTRERGNNNFSEV